MGDGNTSLRVAVVQAGAVATNNVVMYNQLKYRENESILEMCPSLSRLSIGKGSAKCEVRSARCVVRNKFNYYGPELIINILTLMK